MPKPKLTPRETDVLDALERHGWRRDRAYGDLNITRKTLDTHLANIQGKFLLPKGRGSMARLAYILGYFKGKETQR